MQTKIGQMQQQVYLDLQVGFYDVKDDEWLIVLQLSIILQSD